MAIFVELKLFLRYLGLLEFDGRNAALIAIILQTCVLSAILCGTAASLGYIIMEECTLGELIQCIGSSLALFYCGIVCVTFLFQKKRFLHMIDIIQAQIEERERKYGRTVYKQRSEEVEQLTIKVRYFINVALIALLIIPTSIVSYFNFYVKDKGPASFVLFAPMK